MDPRISLAGSSDSVTNKGHFMVMYHRPNGWLVRRYPKNEMRLVKSRHMLGSAEELHVAGVVFGVERRYAAENATHAAMP